MLFQRHFAMADRSRRENASQSPPSRVRAERPMRETPTPQSSPAKSRGLRAVAHKAPGRETKRGIPATFQGKAEIAILLATLLDRQRSYEPAQAMAARSVQGRAVRAPFPRGLHLQPASPLSLHPWRKFPQLSPDMVKHSPSLHE